MSYTPNVPVSGQSLGNSRPIINQNFQTIQTVFDINHVDFNVSGAGKHNLIQIPTAQSASPGTIAGEIALYSKNVSGVPQLFFQKQNIAAAGADIQMTTNVDPVALEGGTSFLPGGLILQWGKAANGGAGTTIVGFNSAFPNNVFNVSVTPISAGATYPTLTFGTRFLDLATFGITASASNQVQYPFIYWMAIGN